MVRDITGKTPVIWGSDFSFCYEGAHPEKFQHCGPLNLSDPSDSVVFTGLHPQEARSNMINEVYESPKVLGLENIEQSITGTFKVLEP